LEAKVVEDRHDRRNVAGLGLDREVDDALAGQARDRRAADVLDRQVGPPLADELTHPILILHSDDDGRNGETGDAYV
jgi:hypothetical protein